MTKFVLIEKTSDCKEVEVKNLKIEDLYKKCGYRKLTEDFRHLTSWKVKVQGRELNLQLYGKSKGKANTENKTELPPPVDKELYFGTLALINYDTEFNDLTIEEWEKAYEKLYGGFENIVDTIEEDENEEDELENVSDSEKTKSGYLKDGFVVTSSDDSDSECFTDDEDVEEEQYEFSDTEF
jgi:hypothetical protein